VIILSYLMKKGWALEAVFQGRAATHLECRQRQRLTGTGRIHSQDMKKLKEG
jgi:hypothetical protein